MTEMKEMIEMKILNSRDPVGTNLTLEGGMQVRAENLGIDQTDTDHAETTAPMMKPRMQPRMELRMDLR